MKVRRDDWTPIGVQSLDSRQFLSARETGICRLQNLKFKFDEEKCCPLLRD